MDPNEKSGNIDGNEDTMSKIDGALGKAVEQKDMTSLLDDSLPVEVNKTDQDSSSNVDEPLTISRDDDKKESTWCVDEPINEDQTHCGLGPCQPAFAQRFRKVSWFTATYSVSAITTSALSTYIGSQLTTLEKYFNMNSSTSGFLMSCNDLGYLSVTLLMSYLTRRVHVPRGVAFSTFVYGMSGLLCSIAYFITRDQIPQPPKDSDSYIEHSDVTFTQICKKGTLSVAEICNQGSSGNKKNVFEITDKIRTISIVIIAIGMFVQGMAKSPRQPFIGTYVDDNVSKTRTTLYIGIITSFSVIGPAIAYGIGSITTNIYVTLEDTNITPRDPRWMGAWWIGFVGFGSIGLVAGVPLIFFPRYMTVSTKLRIQNLELIEKKTSYWKEVKNFLKSYFRLCSNPCYMCLVVATGINLFAISGVMSFMPKYLESQFSVTASKANVVLGVINVLSATIGTMISGYLTSRFKLTPLTCLKLLILSALLANFLMIFGFGLGCDQPVIITGSKIDSEDYLSTRLITQALYTVILVLMIRKWFVLARCDSLTRADKTIPNYFGISASSGRSSVMVEPRSKISATTDCLQDCDCEDDDYFPVCGSDNQNYFSPCHAGCTYMNNSMFVNCSCIATNNTQRAKAGLCVPDCNNLFKYIAMSMAGGFITTLAIMPNFLVTIRSVKEQDKPMSIGFGAFLGTLLGWLPGPMVFGLLVDTTCVLRKFTCTAVGACLLYDIELFRFRLHFFLITLRLVTITLYIVVYILATFSKTPVFQANADATPDEEARKLPCQEKRTS